MIIVITMAVAMFYLVFEGGEMRACPRVSKGVLWEI